MKRTGKRIFDILLSLFGLLFFFLVIALCLFLAAIDTRSSGFFVQLRIGQFGKPFRIYKLRTMRNGRISGIGAFLRRSKFDELPQLFNVLIGDMSIVGPRPDIPGYYDLLQGCDRRLLELKPGITGPASLKYANEEVLLATMGNPLEYNDTVIFPDKVRINLLYLDNQSFWLDIKIIFYTIFGKEINIG